MTNATAPVLVLGMSQTGLSTLRLLGRTGITCYSLDAIERVPAFWSRYCRGGVRLSPDSSDQQILDGIVAFSADLPLYTVLLPTSDRMVQLISRSRDQLSRIFRLLLPEETLVEDLLDKSRFAERALAMRASVPRGMTVSDTRDFSDAVSQLGLPVILKPVRQDDIAGTDFPKALLLEREEQIAPARQVYAACNGLRLLAQEYIPGKDSQLFSVGVCLDRDSRVLATFTARKRRQGNNGTGVGHYVEAVYEPAVEAAAIALLREMKCVGVAEVELKRHAETGRLYVIEVNLRVWLQVTLPAAFGLNFPALFYALAAGIAPPPVLASISRRRADAWQDLVRDCYVTLRPGGYLAKGEISAREWIMDCLRARSGPYFCLRDPLPALAWACHLARKLFRRGKVSELTSGFDADNQIPDSNSRTYCKGSN